MMQNQVCDLLDDVGSDYELAFGLLDEKDEAMGGRGSVGMFDWDGSFNTQYFADRSLFSSLAGSSQMNGWNWLALSCLVMRVWTDFWIWL